MSGLTPCRGNAKENNPTEGNVGVSRIFYITYVVCTIFLLDSTSLELITSSQKKKKTGGEKEY